MRTPTPVELLGFNTSHFDINQLLQTQTHHDDTRDRETMGDGKYDDTVDDEEEALLAWIPKKIVSEWINDDGIKCISIIIQLSGGSTLTDSNDAVAKGRR